MSNAETGPEGERPDVQAFIDKAKEAATTAKDKSVDAATVVRHKVGEFVGTNENRIGEVIDKTGGFVDEKLTGHRFSDKIDRAQGAIKGAVSKVGEKGDNPDEGSSGDAG